MENKETEKKKKSNAKKNVQTILGGALTIAGVILGINQLKNNNNNSNNKA